MSSPSSPNKVEPAEEKENGSGSPSKEPSSQDQEPKEQRPSSRASGGEQQEDALESSDVDKQEGTGSTESPPEKSESQPGDGGSGGSPIKQEEKEVKKSSSPSPVKGESAPHPPDIISEAAKKLEKKDSGPKKEGTAERKSGKQAKSKKSDKQQPNGGESRKEESEGGSSDSKELREKNSDSKEEENKNEEEPIAKGKLIIMSGLTGTVRWFNVKHAYGFINRDDTGIDVFVHQTSIKQNNPKRASKTLGDGEKVEFDIIKGAKGLEAVNVTGPDGGPVIGSDFVPFRPYGRGGRRYEDFYDRRPMRRRPRAFTHDEYHEAPTMDFQPFDMISGAGPMRRGGPRRRPLYYDGDGDMRPRGRSFRRNRPKTEDHGDTRTESESKDTKKQEKGSGEKAESADGGNKGRVRRRVRRNKKERLDPSESQGSEKVTAVTESKKKRRHAKGTALKEEGTQTEV